MKLIFRRHLTLDRPAAAGYRHLSAASGLVRAGEKLHVVGDDELYLATFAITGKAPGRLTRLFPGTLPADDKLRKAAKPDLETLVALPASQDWPQGALLAMGSGSTPRRRRGVIAALDATGNMAKVRVLDLSTLFEKLASAVDEINVEGAAVLGNRLLLFNRGNVSHSETVILGVALQTITQDVAPSILSRNMLNLPSTQNVPFSSTDACALDDGSIVFSAVAEDTRDAYQDGRLLGAAIGVLDADLNLIRFEPVDPVVKIEGVQAWRTETSIRFLAVTDADDPAIAAALYEGTIVS